MCKTMLNLLWSYVLNLEVKEKHEPYIGIEFVSQVSVLTLKHNFVSCLITIAKGGIV